MAFADPGTGRVVEWHESRRTTVWLDRIDTQFWLVAILSTPCESGYGHLPVWKAYSFRDGQWHAMDPAEVPVVPARNLLTTDYPVTKELRCVSLSPTSSGGTLLTGRAPSICYKKWLLGYLMSASGRSQASSVCFRPMSLPLFEGT